MFDRVEASLRELAATVRLAVFDFDGVFTDNTVYVDQDGRESVRCWRSDGLGLRKLDRLGIASMILSTEVNPVVAVRAAKLKIPCVHGLDDKRSALEREAAARGIELAHTCYVGNDINDLGCLRVAGLPIVVADAHPEVVSLARYRTDAPGGRGAVREVCDLLEWTHARPV